MRTRLSRRWVGLVLGAAVVAAISGCESPFRPSAEERGFSNYSASLIARAVSDPKFMEQAVSPTVNKGVVENTRVDTAGTVAVAPTTVPGDNRPPWSPSDLTVGDAASRFNVAERPLQLALQEALARAMRHNLEIRVEAYNPAIKELQIVEAQAIFDPAVVWNSQWSNADPATPPSAGVSPSVQQRGQVFTNQVGVRDLLPTGGTVTATAGLNYFDLKPGGLFFNGGSGYNPNLNLSLSQPLLRGFGQNVTSANIYLAQRDLRITLAQFRRRVTQVAADVEEAYHNLVLAASVVRIQQDLAAQTEITRRRVWERLQIDADLVSYAQVVAAVEQRRAELVRARADLRNASDRLKLLLNDPELNLRDNGLLTPSDRPITAPIIYNVADEVEHALRYRTEIQEARLQVERADIVVDVARNDLLPQADMTLGMQSNGQIDSSLDAAFSSTFNAAKFIDYNMGLKFVMPIGNRQAESVFRRRQLERRQALTNLVAQALAVVGDVKTRLRTVLTSHVEIDARDRARKAANDELAGLTEQEQIKQLTPEFLRLKLDAQQRLANAEILELQAIVNYNVAIAKLEQAKGTLLEFNRIAINQEPPREDPQKTWILGNTVQWNDPFKRK